MDIRRNNFDFLRLLAAILVVFGHAYDLNGVASPVLRYTDGQTAEGGIGVLVFFVISGFLITQSYLKRQDWRQFLKARFLRIIPGLGVVVLLTVFVLGPLVTGLSIMDYFADGMTWRYLKNLLPLNVKYQLPGVFPHNPHGPNGSLWTIPIELRCYFWVLVLGMLGLFRYRWAVLVVYAAAYGAHVLYSDSGLTSHDYFYLLFFTGTVLFLFREFIVYRGWVAALALAGLYIAGRYHFLLDTMPLLGAYVVFYLANLKALPLYELTGWGDISYGVYIYAFPIQQFLIHLSRGKMNPVYNFIFTLPLCFACATFSWFWIEKPALRYKGKMKAVSD